MDNKLSRGTVSPCQKNKGTVEGIILIFTSDLTVPVIELEPRWPSRVRKHADLAAVDEMLRGLWLTVARVGDEVGMSFL